MLPLQSAVNKLRIRTATTSQAAARNAVARQLETAELTPPALAPAAILLIRSMRDPLPGRLATDRNSIPADECWQREIQSRIVSIARSASVPIRGRVHGDADAVIFADEAELLACIARDLACRNGPVPWWCRAITRQIPQSSLFTLLCAHIELVPAMFRMLTRWNSLDEVVLALDAEQTRQLRRELVRNLALRHVERALAPIDADLADTPALGLSSGAIESTNADRVDASTDHREIVWKPPADLNPFRAWFTPTNVHGTVEQQILLGIALGVDRALAEISGALFAQRVAEWVRWSTSNVRVRTSARIDVMNHGAFRTEKDDRSSTMGDALDSARDGRNPTPVESPSTEPEHSASQDFQFQSGVELPADPGRQIEAASTEQLDDRQIDGADCRYVEDGIETRIGGIFYLINLMEHLQLPECFEAEWRLASAVGAVGTMETIARGLVSEASIAASGDAVWTLLAELDRRTPNTPPRCAGLIPNRLQLPQKWLAEFTRDDAIDPSCSLSLMDGIAIEALRKLDWPEPLVAWLVGVLAFLRWRLDRALGAACGDGSLRGLLALPARVYVTDTHIDLVASIEDVRLPVRMAGLDRSPGWVASMQRVVLFHFE
jgi:hypothetical protein